MEGGRELKTSSNVFLFPFTYLGDDPWSMTKKREHVRNCGRTRPNPLGQTKQAPQAAREAPRSHLVDMREDLAKTRSGGENGANLHQNAHVSNHVTRTCSETLEKIVPAATQAHLNQTRFGFSVPM